MLGQGLIDFKKNVYTLKKENVILTNVVRIYQYNQKSNMQLILEATFFQLLDHFVELFHQSFIQ